MSVAVVQFPAGVRHWPAAGAADPASWERGKDKDVRSPVTGLTPTSLHNSHMVPRDLD